MTFLRMKKVLALVLCIFVGTGARTITLSTGWTLKNSTLSIENVTVPSGVYTELAQKGYTQAVLYSKNDVDLRWIGDIDWTYELKFNCKCVHNVLQFSRFLNICSHSRHKELRECRTHVLWIRYGS